MLEVLFVIGLVAFVAMLSLLGVGALVALRIVRSTHRRATRAVTDVRLRAQALPGRPGRDIAVLRRELRECVRHGEFMLADPAVERLTAAAGWSDGPALLREAGGLDAHLALIEREPDRALREHLVARLAPRVEQVLADSAALRSAIYAWTVEFETPGERAIRQDRRDRMDGLTSAIRDLVADPLTMGAPRRGRSRASGRGGSTD